MTPRNWRDAAVSLATLAEKARPVNEGLAEILDAASIMMTRDADAMSDEVAVAAIAEQLG